MRRSTPALALWVEEISHQWVHTVYAIDCGAWVIRLLATSIANTCMKPDRSTPTKNLTTAALSSTFVTSHSLLLSNLAATSWQESSASRVNYSTS